MNNRGLRQVNYVLSCKVGDLGRKKSNCILLLERDLDFQPYLAITAKQVYRRLIQIIQVWLYNIIAKLGYVIW